jgi:hypothetical protein
LYSAVKFKERWNVPNVIGCTAGRHIRIKRPSKRDSPIYNCSFFYGANKASQILKADPFLQTHTGAYGQRSDGTFSASAF